MVRAFSGPVTRNAQNAMPGTVGSLYTIFKDVNGSGSILGSDVMLVRNRRGISLPAGEPIIPISESMFSIASPATTRSAVGD